MKKLLATLAVALLALTGISRADEYPDISIEGLKKAIAAKKVAIIDVNGSGSYNKAHIPGAVDFQASKDSLAKVLPKDKDTLIVAYCGGPSCNAYTNGAKAAQALGYKNVKHLSAGISGWVDAKEKTEAGEAKKEKGKDEKKTTSTDATKHTFVATFTGVACSACEAKVTKAIASLPGGADVKFEAGKKEGTKLVTFTAENCGCPTATKDSLVAALGDNAKTFVVQEVSAQN